MSGPRTYSKRELQIARAIYRAMKGKNGALVDGSPGEGDSTLIDGTFDLRKIARKVLAAMPD
jgi:hypothetical protein